MPDQTIFHSIHLIKQDDIDGIGDPVGTEHHIVLQTGAVVITEADTQIAEPVQQIPTNGVAAFYATLFAEVAEGIAKDVVFGHILKHFLQSAPGGGEGEVQNVHFFDLPQKHINEFLPELLVTVR